ncbi:MAG: hypothetical protein ACI3YS_01040 [Prevotella sp.]
MKQQIYNLEEFATYYHLQDIFGAYVAYFTINRKDNENDADFKVRIAFTQKTRRNYHFSLVFHLLLCTFAAEKLVP